MMTFTEFIDITGGSFDGAPFVAGGLRATYNTGSGGVPASAAQIAAARAAGMTVLLYDQSPSLASFAAGDSDMADVETLAGTIANMDAAIIARRGRGLTVHTVYCNYSTYPSARASISDLTGVWFGVADYAWSLAEAEALLSQNADWGYVQFGDPKSNPSTEVPGTTVTLAQCNADINVASSAWLAEVTGSIPAPAPAPSPAPSNWQEAMMQQLPEVSQGATGAYVRSVQGLCTARGHTATVDGVFGPLTKAAVEAVQAGAHIGVDGVVGPQTWPALLGV